MLYLSQGVKSEPTAALHRARIRILAYSLGGEKPLTHHVDVLLRSANILFLIVVQEFKSFSGRKPCRGKFDFLLSTMGLR